MSVLHDLQARVSSVRAKLGGHTELILIAAGVSAISMAAGMAALAGGGWWWTLPAALLVIRTQVLLSRVAHLKGWAGPCGWVFYALLMSFSAALSVGALVNLLSGDRAAQKAFEQSAHRAFPQLDAVAASYAGAANSLEFVSRHSKQEALLEDRDGGTCGGIQHGTQGPVWRLRHRDDDQWQGLADQFRATANQLEASKSAAEAAIGAYQVKRHAEVARSVNAALDAARLAARSPEFGTMRSAVAQRISEFTSGSPDPQTRQMVFCPDPILAGGLQSALKVEPPSPPSAVDLPLAPSHESAIRGFVAHLAAVLTGRTDFDAELYLLPMLGIAPELAFLLGLALRAREQAPAEDRLAGVNKAAGLSASNWSDLREIARLAANDHVFLDLTGFHVEDRSRWGVVDYLVVPDDVRFADIQLFAQALVTARMAIDKGRGRAGAAWGTFTPVPADPDAAVRFIRLKRGVWRKLMMEVLAASARGSPRQGALFPMAAEQARAS